MTKRFRFTVDFNRYSQQDLIDIGTRFYGSAVASAKDIGKNTRILKKILSLKGASMNPGDLKNIIYSAIAFNSTDDRFDHLRRILREVDRSSDALNIERLKNEGFSLRAKSGLPLDSAWS